MPNEHPTDVSEIERLVLAAQPHHHDIHGSPVLVLQNSQHLEILTNLLPHPPRKQSSPVFQQSESFIRYVNEQKTDASRIYLQGDSELLAIFDHHETVAQGGLAGWGQHRALFRARHSLQWANWYNENRKKLYQKEFCEFIEDNRADIMEETDMVELVRNFQANSSVAYEGYEQGDGSVHLSFQKIVNARAGQKGEIEVPQTFKICIPCFDGGASLEMVAKLRFEICDSDKKLKLWYELQKVQQILKAHTALIVADVAKKTGINPFYGTI